VSDRGSGRRKGVVRSFVVGGLVGAAAAVVAPRLRRRGPAPTTRPVSGLEAFEGAPCWHHDRDRAAADGGGGE
jgi:hypothetical protein